MNAAISPSATSQTVASQEAHDLEALLDKVQYMEETASASPYAACLLPLLTALGWQGTVASLADALPQVKAIGAHHFADVLGRLGYHSEGVTLSAESLDRRLVPSILTLTKKQAQVMKLPAETPLILTDYRLEARPDGKGMRVTLTVFNGATRSLQKHTVPSFALRGRVAVYRADGDRLLRGFSGEKNWFSSLLSVFRGSLATAMVCGLVAAVFALAPALFIMVVYDRVIPIGGELTLLWLSLGFLFALGADYALKHLRGGILAAVGERMNRLMGHEIFSRLLRQPPSNLERASAGAQLSRILDFSNFGSALSGPFAHLLFEAPSLVLFTLVIALIAGPLAWIPVIAAAVMITAGLLIGKLARGRSNAVAQAHNQWRKRLVELMIRQRNIRQTLMTGGWLVQLANESARAGMARNRLSKLTALGEALGYWLCMMAGLAALGMGAGQVMGGAMTGGALLAVMILTWRILTPLQKVFTLFTRFTQLRASAKQVDTLLQRPAEPVTGLGSVMSAPRTAVNENGLSLKNVTFRYTPEDEAVLQSLNIEAKGGEVIGITGKNGSGKSTILKLLIGLYRPLAGRISIGGVNIKQLPPQMLRRAVGYLPQYAVLQYGTVAENMRLVNPTLSEREILSALKAVGAEEEVLALPHGLDTPVAGMDGAVSLSRSLERRLCMARVYLKHTPVMLFDEPVEGLTPLDFERFREMVNALRGSATIVIVSHRPHVLALCDRVVAMEEGGVVFDGAAAQILPPHVVQQAQLQTPANAPLHELTPQEMTQTPMTQDFKQKEAVNA